MEWMCRTLWMEPLKERRASRCTTTCVLEIGHIFIFFEANTSENMGCVLPSVLNVFYGCMVAKLSVL